MYLGISGGKGTIYHRVKHRVGVEIRLKLYSKHRA